MEIDFKTKAITRQKEGHYIMLKVSIQLEDTTLINTCAPNVRAPKYIKTILIYMKGEINGNTK